MSFLRHAEAHGLLIRDLIADGRWHRVPTTDKPKKKNGAYLFDGQRGVVKNFATMLEYAAYKDGQNVGPIDKAALRMRIKLAEIDVRVRQEEARRSAEDMLKRAVVATHPYLERKGFPQQTGFTLDGELLIPMRDFAFYKRVNSLQRIKSDGEKKFLPGGKAKGSVFFIGPLTADERWLVEGYATGLSVHAATTYLHRRAQVIVCFSDSNLAHIGRLVQPLRPRAYVFADNDESRAGERAAQASGLMWCMSPMVGEDANDYHQRAGLPALARLIRELNAVRQRAGAA